jgi:hypothetical protein
MSIVNTLCEVQGQALSVPGACPHCSSPFSAVIHGGPCPRIRAIEYHPSGTVKRIEYHDENAR